MRTAPEKKFLIIAPIIGGGPFYWMAMGRGNTDHPWEAHKYAEKQARELCEKDNLLKMIPVK